MTVLGRVFGPDLRGVHFAVNIFVAATAIWLLLRTAAVDPIWAISAMVAVTDPQTDLAYATFRGRIGNSLIGCAIGLSVLAIGGAHAWKLPFAMAVAVLISSYVIRMPNMWRQAPITAALVIAAGLSHHSKVTGLEVGARRVGEVLLGSIVGLVVALAMSKIWPLAPPSKSSPKPATTSNA
jgi:uncharacterized membrane protein YccC